MKIHHLNCGSMCPHAVGGATFVCHVLLLETDSAGLVLVDSGYGLHDVHDPRRIGFMRHLLRPRFDEAETAIRQVEALGFRADDVRHIVLTHLDIDHGGALGDFPDAEVHLLAAEHFAGTSLPTRAEKGRYKPAQWAHGPNWRPHSPDGGDSWEGFEAVRPIAALADRVALIPLPGHTRGHAGIAVDAGDRWLLHAGDAYYLRHLVPSDGSQPTKPAFGVRLFQRLAAFDEQQRRDNLARLQQLAHDAVGRVRVFPAHDEVELEDLRTSSR